MPISKNTPFQLLLYSFTILRYHSIFPNQFPGCVEHVKAI